MNMFGCFLLHTAKAKQLQNLRSMPRNISGNTFVHSAVCTILKAMHVKLLLANAFPVNPVIIGYRL